MEVDFTPGAVSPADSTVELGGDVVDGGGAPLQIVVTPRDACGLALGAGHAVSAGASYGTVSSSADRGDGSYAFDYRVGDGRCEAEPARLAVYVDDVLVAEPRIATRCAAPAGPRIVTTPRTVAMVGVPYVVDDDRAFEAEGGAVVWFVVEGPAGFRVDPVTGFVGFVPRTAGRFDVAVAASNATGESVLRYTLEVRSDQVTPPVAVIDLVPDGDGGGFTADASRSTPGGGGAVTAATWDFGDGSPPQTGLRVHHRVDVPEARVVRVTVVDAAGVTAEAASAFVPAFVDGAPPVARILASSVAGDGALDVQLSCACTVGDAPIQAWHWDFGDGDVVDAPAVTRTFGPGGWSVRLTVIDARGRVASDRTFLSVTRAGNLPPLVTASANVLRGPAPLSTSFLAAVGDLDGTVASLAWDFGDGGSSDEPAPAYEFRTPGRYVVTLQATDDQGLVATTSLEIDVTAVFGDSAPTVLSTPRTSARTGEPWLYDDDGIAIARGSRPLTWVLGKQVGDTLVGAPAGMRVNPATGALTWTPTTPGTHHVVLVAWNGAGADAQEFDVDVVGDAIDDPPAAAPPAPSGPSLPTFATDGEAPASCAGGPTSAAAWPLLAGLLWFNARRRRRAA